MIAKIKGAIAATMLMAGVTVSAGAQAATLGVDFPAGATDFGQSSWNLGWSFTANSNVSVVGLGDWFGASFPQDQQVGLWDSSGTLLASTFVSNSDSLMGSAPWRFASIKPVQLIAGHSYVVGGQGGADYTGEISSPTFASQITYITDLYTYNGSTANSPLVEPTTTENLPYGWFGGNIEIGVAATPLPSTWFMLLSAFVGLGFFIYRGSKKGSALSAA